MRRGFEAPDPTGGKLQSSRDPLAGFQGAASRQGRGKVRGEGREGRKGKGIAFPTSSFYNLTSAQQCIVAATYTRLPDLAL